MSLTLHHYWRSSSSWRVRWALAHKGLTYEAVDVNLLEGAQQSADYRRASPTGYVPALGIDGRTLGESVAILEYLDERFPEPPLKPADPWLRARMRQMVEIVNAGTQPLQNLWVLRRIASDKDGQAAWGREVVARGLGALEELVTVTRDEGGPGPFAIADTPTIADLFLVPQLFNARRFDVDLSAFPQLVAAEAACLATEACRASAPSAWEPR